jgi:hypothetical protein
MKKSTRKSTEPPNPKKRPAPSGTYTQPQEPTPAGRRHPTPELVPPDDENLHIFVRFVLENPGHEATASWVLVADRAEREELVRRQPHSRKLTVGKVGRQYLQEREDPTEARKSYMNIQVTLAAQAKSKRLAAELGLNVKDVTSQILEATYDTWRHFARFGQTPWEALRSLAAERA